MNQANIISADDAGINKSDISKNALKVVRDIQSAGHQAYLVGGCVRDLLLEMKPKDFDVATDATPEQVKKICSNSRIIGRRFKLVHVRFGYDVIEVATFRGDASDRDRVGTHEMSEGDQGQLLRDNVYGTLEEDVVRRDFRANALYYDPVAGEIFDFMNGLDDIRAGKLVSIGEPKQRFREDPVRMLRVIRFAAKLGFEMEPEAMEMIEQEGSLLSHVSAARLFEEVLKLFHGGAAYETYLLLREYGLFKYLFPFTDQCVIEGAEGMPERALKNTDKRIKQGKPVIPAFLFACMMWDPVKQDAQVLMSDGTPESQAWRIAMNDALRDQNQYVAVPRRLAEIILDIWNIHFRLIKRNPRMVKTSLGNRRFRAAYDFLLLRANLHEVDEEIGEWWTEIQEQDDAGKAAMISDLSKQHKQSRNQHDDAGEANGNSVNYNSEAYNQNSAFDASGAEGQPQRQNRNRSNKKRGGGKAAGKRRGGRGGGRNGTRRGTGQRARAGGGNANEENGNSVGNSGGNSRAQPGNSRAGGRGGRGRGRGGRGRGHLGRGTNAEPRFNDARPADEFGHHSSTDNQKKVKVRRKRRIATATEGSDGGGSDSDTPHF
ncbi:MAG: polynucleotide adenylyltransferase PcnB [Gammaproteobacteria bacterium]|nr:polynucleotide adenylyltransferase PcnB [Gammaproteobacteria bacterium]